MILKVTERGLTIPKRLLRGARQVNVRQEEDRLVIEPVVEDDPILGIGSDPVRAGTSDASTRHDSYLYNDNQ